MSGPYRLGAADVARFHARGLLGPWRCEAPELARVAPPGGGETANLHLADPQLLALCSHPSIVDRVASVLGRGGVALFKTRFWVKQPGAALRAPWHQDVGPSNGGCFPDGSPVPTVTVWLAFDGADVDSGTLRVVPGSHRRLCGDWRRNIQARLEESGALAGIDLDAAVPLLARPGEMFLFHSWLLHASGPNRSARRRMCLNLRFASVADAVEEKFTSLVLRPADSPPSAAATRPAPVHPAAGRLAPVRPAWRGRAWE